MKNCRFLFLCFLFTIPQFVFAQVGINTDDSDPDASAILDIKSTDKGVLVPRMTSAQRTMISNAAIGLLVFDTDTEGFWFKDTNGWVELASGSPKSIADADNDTKIQVEESADEDKIRFDLEGSEMLILNKTAAGRPRLEFPNSNNSLYIGEQAGENDSGTGNNVAIGNNVLKDNTSGQGNTALGIDAMALNTTGNSNVALGHAALLINNTGRGNIGIGPTAGAYNQNGDDNILIGTDAGGHATIGVAHDKSNNVMIGANAGSTNTGDNNVFLGHFAGYAETGSHKLIIESEPFISNPLIYGEFNNDLLRINGTLNINSAFSFPTTDGTANQVLKTDGAGTLAWTDAASGGSQTLIEDTDNDTKIQVEESADEDIIRFDLAGTEAATLFRSSANLTALTLPNNANNIMIGSQTGYGNTNADGRNVFIGNRSGLNSTTGRNNVALGHSAGISVADGNSNIFIGALAGSGMDGGSNNIVLGKQAAFLATNVENSVMIGQFAGTNASGVNNVFLGSHAGKDETAGNRLHINNGQGNTSLIYGEFDNRYVQINGELGVAGKYTFPNALGANNQILKHNGTGTLEWAEDVDTDDQTIDVLNLNGSTLEISLEDDGQDTQTLDLSSLNATSIVIEDADNDTKIQVEESADEDIIRFDLAGSEVFRISKNTNGATLFESPSSGLNSTLFGQHTGELLSTGQYNAFFGKFAGRTTSSGQRNSFFGLRAGNNNTTGSYNVFVGEAGGYSNTTGSRNTYIGAGSGRNNLVGTDNVFLGSQAGTNELGSHKLYIENSLSVTPLIYGEFDNDLLRVNGTLNINSAFSFPTTDGTANQILQTDGSGTLTWEDVGSSVQTLIEDADNDTKIQVEKSADEDIIRFDLSGSERMTLSNGRLEFPNNGNSVSLGNNAGLNDDLNQRENTFVGNNTGKNVTTGERNVVIGSNAMGNSSNPVSFNTIIGATAAENNNSSNLTAVGYNALKNQSSGFANTAVGSCALYSSSGGRNVGLGYDAGFNQTSGKHNVFVGYEAGQGTASYVGERNVVLGHAAGFSMQGSDNIFIGNQAGYSETGSNRLYIENSNAAAPLIYGEFENDLVRINGTLNINNAFSFPTADGLIGQILQTDGSGGITWTDFSSSILQDADNDTKIQVEENADEDIIRFDIAGSERLRIENDGTLNINNAFSFPTTDGTNEQILQTNGSGNLAWTNLNKISKINGWSATANNSNLSIKDGLSSERFNFSNSKLTMNAGINANFGYTQVIEFKDGSNINQISNVFPSLISLPPPTDSDYLMRFSVKGNEILELTATGEVTINENYTLPSSDGNADEVLVTDGNGNASWKNVGVPIGTIQMWTTATPPTGWLICDGSTFNSSAYSDLATVLGTTTLPNFNGRMPLGVGQSNETGATNHPLNQTGGEETHTLSISEMPSHSHGITYREGEEGGSGNDYSDLGDSGVTNSTESEGGGAAHNNMPPFYTLYFIIRAN